MNWLWFISQVHNFLVISSDILWKILMYADRFYRNSFHWKEIYHLNTTLSKYYWTANWIKQYDKSNHLFGVSRRRTLQLMVSVLLKSWLHLFIRRTKKQQLAYVLYQDNCFDYGRNHLLKLAPSVITGSWWCSVLTWAKIQKIKYSFLKFCSNRKNVQKQHWKK